MALKAMADNGTNITCQEDARMYDYLAGGNCDYVIKGVGQGLNVTHNTGSLLVTLGTGECVIQGRHITNTNSSDTRLNLPQNSNGYLVLRYDLSQSTGNECKFTYTSVLEDDDLNNNGVKRDIVLARYQTNYSGVSSYTDMRNYSLKTAKGGFVGTQTLTFSTSGGTSQTAVFDGDLTSNDYKVYLNYPSTSSYEQIQAIGECMPWITGVSYLGSTRVTVELKSGKAPKMAFTVEVVMEYVGQSK